MRYTLKNDRFALTVGSLGAEIQSLVDREGRELIWQADPAVWPRHAPVCFPWCGKVEEGWFLWRGRRQAAGTQHGFVRDMEHALTGQGADRLEFRLDWPGEEAGWPWSFSFTTVHTLVPDGTQSVCTAENRSAGPMPVQLGFHPGFTCPFLPGTAAEEYCFRFESGRVVEITGHLFDDDSIRFFDVGDWVRLEHRETGKYIQVETAGFPNVLLWSKPGIPGFVCIEPWQGYPGPGHDLAARPGAVVLESGQQLRRVQRIGVHL